MDRFDGLTDDDLFDWLAPALAGVTDDLASADQGPDFLLQALESQLSSAGEPFAIDSPLQSLPHETLVGNFDHRTDNVPAQTQPGSRKPRRKRGPTTQQQVAALEKLLAAQTLEAQELSKRNLWLQERVRMLEVVIAVKDVQGVRIKEVQAGLTFNPFATCIGATPEQLAQASPAWVAAKFLELTGVMAVRLAPLLPHLQRHPHLLWGPDPHTRWPDSPTRLPQHAPPVHELWRTTGPQLPCSCLPASTAQPLCGQQQQLQQGSGVPVGCASGAKVHGAPDASVIQELHDLVVMVAGLQRSHQYIFWIQPKMLLASSVHAHAIEPALHTQWDNLLNSVHTEGTAGCTAPPTAPESHWKMVAGSMMLSDQQKLQAAVLWDLISKAIASVAAQRAALGSAMAKLRGLVQQDQPSQAAPDTSARAKETFNQHHGQGQPSTAASVTNASVMQQEEVIVKKLQLTLMKQGCLVVLGAETCFASLLTPVQLAMAMVSCYPYIPDDMAMLHAAAEQFNSHVLARLQQATTPVR